jgi:hypothetical protein
MRWVPRWLGETYTTLFLEYGEDSFSSTDCQKTLGKTMSSTRVSLSKLAREGYLVKERKGRKILYTCIDPYKSLVKIEGLPSIPQTEYIPLLEEFVSEALRSLRDDLVGMILYGSIARGDADENSDMDILLVAEGLPERFTGRIEHLYPIKQRCRDIQIRLWRERGIYCNIQLYPLSPEELEGFRPLFLDITTDGIVVFDRSGLTEKRLNKWRKKLSKRGAKKVVLPDGHWYWDLGVQKGEVLEI